VHSAWKGKYKMAVSVQGQILGSSIWKGVLWAEICNSKEGLEGSGFG
jgi:hypothetical protein